MTRGHVKGYCVVILSQPLPKTRCACPLMRGVANPPACPHARMGRAHHCSTVFANCFGFSVIDTFMLLGIV